MRRMYCGFTLIEMMITVAIVGILAGIAYPAYIKQVQKSNRSDAKVALSDVAQRLQRCFTAHSNYNPADGVCAVVDEVKSSAGISSPEGMYVIKVAVAATDLTASTYLLTATPVAGSRQASDSDCTKFTLNQAGVRIAYKSAAVNTSKCW